MPCTPRPAPEGSRVFAQSSSLTSAYARHLQAADSYVRFYGGSVPKPIKPRNERDILEANHQFIRDDDEGDDEGAADEGAGEAHGKKPLDEEKELARKYYDKLYREYAVIDLSQWVSRQIAMRWRTKQEVLSGKGQFTCANLSCTNRECTLDEDPQDLYSGRRRGLSSYELNFQYSEHGVMKQALVKTRVCWECSGMLRFVQARKAEKRREREKRREQRRDKDEGERNSSPTERSNDKDQKGCEDHERGHRSVSRRSPKEKESKHK